MLKSMATELPRDSLDLLPQGVPSDLGATGRKASLDAKTEEGNARETSTVARGGAGGEDLDSGEDLWDLCFNQDDTRKR